MSSKNSLGFLAFFLAFWAPRVWARKCCEKCRSRVKSCLVPSTRRQIPIGHCAELRPCCASPFMSQFQSCFSVYKICHLCPYLPNKPFSNTAVERIFSLVSSLKRKAKNRLHLNLFDAIVIGQSYCFQANVAKVLLQL